jgi:hypothetical protein
MPLPQTSGRSSPSARSLDLPPPFRLVMLREVGDAFAHACARGAELGAGALVVVGRFDVAEFAVVLEPDEPLAAARRIFYLGMIALGDALAALAPPEKPIAIEWPDAFRVDGGLVGGGRLGWPAQGDERARPDWLVFGAAIRTSSANPMSMARQALATALDDEGFGDVGAAHLVESFARHLMAAIDRWQEDGFAAIAGDYVARLHPLRGVRHALEENGDLRSLRPGKSVERRALLPALQAPSWLDPTSGELRR